MKQPWKQIRCYQGRNGVVAVYREPAPGDRYAVRVWDKRGWGRQYETLYALEEQACAAARVETDRLQIGDAADRALHGVV